MSKKLIAVEEKHRAMLKAIIADWKNHSIKGLGRELGYNSGTDTLYRVVDGTRKKLPEDVLRKIVAIYRRL